MNENKKIITLENIKKHNTIKNKKNINNGNFKIVEDKIYDKYVALRYDYSFEMFLSGYYVSTKIYGDNMVSEEIYSACKKDDSIYYLVCNDEKNNNGVTFDKHKEIKRNNKILLKQYLAKVNQLSSEVNEYFVPYNESLGELNYKKRIEYRINQLKERKTKCKKCGKKYTLEEQNICPKCGTEFSTDLLDVINCKEWY